MKKPPGWAVFLLHSPDMAIGNAPGTTVDAPRRPVAPGLGQGAVAIRMLAQIEPVQLMRQVRTTDVEVMDFVFAALLRLGINDESVHRRWISFNDAESGPIRCRLSSPRGRVRSIGKIPRCNNQPVNSARNKRGLAFNPAARNANPDNCRYGNWPPGPSTTRLMCSFDAEARAIRSVSISRFKSHAGMPASLA